MTAEPTTIVTTSRTPAWRARLGAALLASGAVATVALAVLGPALAPHPAEATVDLPYAAPSAEAPLGTDHLGHDVLSLLLLGGWGLLLLATVIAVAVTSLAAGLAATAALRPRVGALLERGADVMILLPPVLAILLVVLSWPEGGALGLVLVSILVGTPYATRVLGASARGVAATGYVEVATASGERLGHLVLREVLPNMRATVLTQLGLRFLEAMYLVSTAAFLQLPTTLGSANWAVMVRENSGGILLNPWAVLAPSLAIGALAISVNLAIARVRGGRLVSTDV